MRYHWFRQCGLFVGSGVIEAGCKSVRPAPQMSGMHWTVNGAGAIATLRCQQASAQKTRSGIHRATRRQPPDRRNTLNDLITYKFVSHPSR